MLYFVVKKRETNPSEPQVTTPITPTNCSTPYKRYFTGSFLSNNPKQRIQVAKEAQEYSINAIFYFFVYVILLYINIIRLNFSLLFICLMV